MEGRAGACLLMGTGDFRGWKSFRLHSGVRLRGGQESTLGVFCWVDERSLSHPGGWETVDGDGFWILPKESHERSFELEIVLSRNGRVSRLKPRSLEGHLTR